MELRSEITGFCYGIFRSYRLSLTPNPKKYTNFLDCNPKNIYDFLD